MWRAAAGSQLRSMLAHESRVRSFCSKPQKSDTPVCQIGGSDFIDFSNSQEHCWRQWWSPSSGQAMSGPWRTKTTAHPRGCSNGY
jgi:hypothetical protein